MFLRECITGFIRKSGRFLRPSNDVWLHVNILYNLYFQEKYGINTLKNLRKIVVGFFWAVSYFKEGVRQAQNALVLLYFCYEKIASAGLVKYV